MIIINHIESNLDIDNKNPSYNDEIINKLSIITKISIKIILFS